MVAARTSRWNDKAELGIEHWARHGIVGRGVLLDAARYMEHQGSPLDATRRFAMDGAVFGAGRPGAAE